MMFYNIVMEVHFCPPNSWKHNYGKILDPGNTYLHCTKLVKSKKVGQIDAETTEAPKT